MSENGAETRQHTTEIQYTYLKRKRSYRATGTQIDKEEKLERTDDGDEETSRAARRQQRR
jgi:hypothetical protein